MSIDFHEYVSRGGNFYVKLPNDDLSVFKIQNKNDNFSRIWCIASFLCTTKVNQCRAKIFEIFFQVKKTIGLYLQNVLMVMEVFK